MTARATAQPSGGDGAQRFTGYVPAWINAGTLYHAQNVIANWSDPQFGYRRSPVGALLHLQEEAGEAADSPRNIFEYADCMMLLLDAIRMAGFPIEAVIAAMYEKLEVNRNRTWDNVQANGVVKHSDATTHPDDGGDDA